MTIILVHYDYNGRHMYEGIPQVTYVSYPIHYYTCTFITRLLICHQRRTRMQSIYIMYLIQ